MPPARVFGNIEIYIKRHEVIIRPKEYIEMIENVVTVKSLGDVRVGILGPPGYLPQEQNIMLVPRCKI